MYEGYFGLREKPFNITPDADFLYMSKHHRTALAMLEYGVFEQSGITVITGEVGAGKTTLVRHLLSTAPADELSIGLVSNVHTSLGSLLQWVAIALDLHTGEQEITNMQVFRRLQTFLINEYAAGRRVVLVIDEAQNMSVAGLEELRMLININSDKNQLLQVVLLGQPELLDVLRQPELKQFAQRVTAEYHLPALCLDETEAYIRSRLHNAGAEDNEIFERTAIEAIYYFSGGLPRLINTLCDHAMTIAYGDNARRIGLDIAVAAARSKRIGGIGRHQAAAVGAEEIASRISEQYGVDLHQILLQLSS